MRQRRSKAYRKLIELYSMSFGFRQPYQVLVDSEMCTVAMASKIDLVKQLETTLHGSVKPMITQCCIHELYLQGRSQQTAVDLAKTFERRKCNHREAIAGDACLTSVIGDTNKHRYMIATQSQPLRAQLRKIPGVPIIHVNRSVMVLEPPSDATIQTKEKTEEEALHFTEPDKAVLSFTSEAPPKMKRRPKGPNPLSVKKKKARVDALPSQKQLESRQIDIERTIPGAKRKHDVLDGGTGNVGRKKRRRKKGADTGAQQ